MDKFCNGSNQCSQLEQLKEISVEDLEGIVASMRKTNAKHISAVELLERLSRLNNQASTSTNEPMDSSFSEEINLDFQFKTPKKVIEVNEKMETPEANDEDKQNNHDNTVNNGFSFDKPAIFDFGKIDKSPATARLFKNKTGSKLFHKHSSHQDPIDKLTKDTNDIDINLDKSTSNGSSINSNSNANTKESQQNFSNFAFSFQPSENDLGSKEFVFNPGFNLGSASTGSTTKSHHKHKGPATAPSSSLFTNNDLNLDNFANVKISVDDIQTTTGSDMATEEAPSPRKGSKRILQKSKSKSSGGSKSNSFVGAWPSDANEAKPSIDEAELNKLAQEGSTMLQSKEYEKAIELFTMCIKSLPSRSFEADVLYLQRATAFFNLERYLEAIDDCNVAIAHNPLSFKVHTRKGRALLKLGMIEDANLVFDSVIALVGNDEEGNNLKDYAKSAKKQIVFIKSLLTKIKNQIEAKDYINGLRSCDELIQVCPFMNLVHLYKCKFLYLQRKWEEMRVYIENYFYSQHSSMRVRHAQTSMQLGDKSSLQWRETEVASEASVDVNSVAVFLLTIGPEFSQCYIDSLKNHNICRGNCCIDSMQKYVQILEIVCNETSINRSNEWMFVHSSMEKAKKTVRGKVDADDKFRSKCFMSSREAYAAIVEIDPTAYVWNAVMYGNRAAAAMRMGLFNEAVVDCNMSLSNDSEYRRSYLRRARAYKAMCDYTSSISDFNRFLSGPSISKAERDEIQKELQETLQAESNKQNNENRERSNQTGSNDTEYSNFKKFTQQQQQQQYKRPSNPRHSQSYVKGNSRSHLASPQHTTTTKKEKAMEQIEFFSKNYYKRLGIEYTSTEQEVKTQYRKLALKFHPDKNKSKDSADIFKSITEAYSVLVDQSSRREYDQTNNIWRGRNSQRYY